MKTALENTMQSIISAGWAVESSGSVDSPTWAYALVEIPSHAGELAEMRDALGDDWETTPAAGWYIVLESDQGFVYEYLYVNERQARERYDELERRYSAWLGEDDLDS